MKNNKNKKKWVRRRHRVVRNILICVLKPYSVLKYGIKVDKFKEQKDRPYLILYNHQTPFDQFFVGMAFKGPVYYLATEDIFSKGWISSLIRWLVAPIPIKKQTTDVRAILNCIKVAREGGTLAIAPEGNRTYSGKTEHMSSAIASLARKLGLPIVIYRIEGGYGTQPRWSDKVRRGKMHSYVYRVIEPEEYADMTDNELFDLIEKELYVDEGVADGEFLSSKRAEYLERAVYVCPYCGFSKFESHGCEITCCTCQRKIIYGSDKSLSGVGFDFPFPFVSQWYDYQKDYVNSLDTDNYTSIPIFTDTADISEVIISKKKIPLKKGCTVCLYGDRVTLDEGGADCITLHFNDISAASVLGRNKLNIYHDNKVYQFKGSKRFNALKYVNLYYRYKNINGGIPDVKFLGL